MANATINPWRPAEISDAPGVGQGHAPHPTLAHPVRPGLSLVAGRHLLYADLVLGLSFRFKDWSPASDAQAEAEEVANEAVGEALYRLDHTPEAREVETAKEAVAAAEDKVREANAELAELRAEFAQVTAGGEWPSGLKALIVETEAKVEHYRRPLADAREALTAAEAKLSAVLESRWRKAAGKRRAELKQRRSDLEQMAREFAATAATELLALDACERQLSRGMPRAARRVPQPDDGVPPPPDIEPVAAE